jgi:hypothetical protein
LTPAYTVGLSYRPASICSLTSRYDNPMPMSTLSPQSGIMNLATVQLAILIPQSNYIYRAPQCMSPRWNWDSPTPLAASECAPPPHQRVGGPPRRLRKGWGGAQVQRLEKRLALCLLCASFAASTVYVSPPPLPQHPSTSPVLAEGSTKYIAGIFCNTKQFLLLVADTFMWLYEFLSRRRTWENMENFISNILGLLNIRIYEKSVYSVSGAGSVRGSGAYLTPGSGTRDPGWLKKS